MSRRPLVTAVVGFGRVAAGYAADQAMAKYYRYAAHAQVLRDHAGFAWRAVVDPSPEAQALARDHWNVAHIAATPRDLPGRDEIEVAVLATPPGESRLAAIESFPALRAVIVEKPLGRTLKEGTAFLDACAKRNVLVEVNLWRRADRTFRALAGGGLAQAIGTVQTGMAIYGNGLHNNGVHIIDMVRMLCGEIESVQALGHVTSGVHLPLPQDIQVAASISLRSGQVLFLAPLDFRAYREVGLDLWGDAGRLSIWQEGLHIAQYDRRNNRAMTGEREVASDAPHLLPTTVGDAFWQLYDDLVSSLDAGTAPCSPGRSALLSEAVIDAIVQSAHTGTPQTIRAPQ